MLRQLATAAFAATIAFVGAFPGVGQATENLLFATIANPASPTNTEVFEPWAKRVNDQGKGVVNVDIRYGTAIANPRNVYDRVVADVIQIGWGLQYLVTNKFPLTEIGALPFIIEPSEYKSEYLSVALWRMYESGALAAEYDVIRPLYLTILTPSQLHMAKPLKTLDNLNGLRIIGPSPHYSAVITSMGGVPLSLTTNEYYEALQRGTAEGIVTGFTAFAPFKLQEVTSYHVDVGLGTAAGMVFMSKKRYDALPAAVRKVIDDNSGEAQSRLFGQYFDRQNDEGREHVKARKHTVVALSDEQYAAWKRKIAPSIEALVQQRPGGDQYLRAFRAEVAAVRKGAVVGK